MSNGDSIYLSKLLSEMNSGFSVNNEKVESETEGNGSFTVATIINKTAENINTVPAENISQKPNRRNQDGVEMMLKRSQRRSGRSREGGESVLQSAMARKEKSNNTSDVPTRLLRSTELRKTGSKGIIHNDNHIMKRRQTKSTERKSGDGVGCDKSLTEDNDGLLICRRSRRIYASKLKSESPSRDDVSLDEDLKFSASDFDSSHEKYMTTDELIESRLCLCRHKTSIFLHSRETTFCDAVDCIDSQFIGCNRTVDAHSVTVVRPSARVPYRLLCSMHHRRQLKHNCCPTCGVFCTQGEFVECQNHHQYHKNCELSIGERQCCPHCGVSTSPQPIHISLNLFQNHFAIHTDQDQRLLDEELEAEFAAREKYQTLNENGSIERKVLNSDISRGKERHPIALVADDVKCPTLPDEYRYITRNCHSTDIAIDMKMTSMRRCVCSDGCENGGCSCAENCVYTESGLLHQEFNYLDPPSIFECNDICSCHWQRCRNRVTQRSRNPPRLEVFWTSSLKGWGVRATERIPRGAFVCEYVGEILHDDIADSRADDSYMFDLDGDLVSDAHSYCIDAKFYGNVSRFINHSCDPNLISIKVFTEHQDLRFPHISLFASRDIAINDELGFDYGEKFWIIKYKSFCCECTSALCKYASDRIQFPSEDCLQNTENSANI